MVKWSVFFFMQRCRTAITFTWPVLHNHTRCLCVHFGLSGCKGITTGWYSTITEKGDKNTNKKQALCSKPGLSWMTELVRRDKCTQKLPRSAHKQLNVRRREERGRHNSRFLRVCRQQSGANTAEFRLGDEHVS